MKKVIAPDIFDNLDQKQKNIFHRIRQERLFQSDIVTYSRWDKLMIEGYWRELLEIFQELKYIIQHTKKWSLLQSNKRRRFVIHHTAIVNYYALLCDIQEIFWSHEEFIRQYLDEHFHENYSTLARYIYRSHFLVVLNCPREFLELIVPVDDLKIHALLWYQKKYTRTLKRTFSFDQQNFWYYLLYRIRLAATWISRTFGNILSRIRFTSRQWGLITSNICQQLTKQLKPGDILLTRGNWNATNLSIPGFWKHMAMYIGTGEYVLDHYSQYLVWQDIIRDEHYIVEAVGTGIHITTLAALALHNDYIAAVRPIFDASKIFQAIETTLSLLGREYDFGLNYYSDVSYVCSALITKAYLPNETWSSWLHIELERIATGIIYPPNSLVRKMVYDQLSQRSELWFIAFVDAREKDQRSFFSSEQQFLLSWKRSKLSFFLD